VARKQTRKAADTRRATKKTAQTKAKTARKPAARTAAKGRTATRKKAGAAKAKSGAKAKSEKSAGAKTAATRRAGKAPARQPAPARAARKKTAARAAATRTRRSRPTPQPPSTIEKATTTVRGALAGMVAAVADTLPWAGAGPDAIDILEREHRQFEELLRVGEATTERAVKGRRELLETLATLLTAHELMEEQVLYPALESHPAAREVVLEGFAEHHVADLIVGELRALSPADEQWGAKFKVLKENIEHHIQEEEGEMFRVARSAFSRDELRELAERMLEVAGRSPR
jgi:hemerythrin-like domain-containing protein